MNRCAEDGCDIRATLIAMPKNALFRTDFFMICR